MKKQAQYNPEDFIPQDDMPDLMAESFDPTQVVNDTVDYLVNNFGLAENKSETPAGRNNRMRTDFVGKLSRGELGGEYQSLYNMWLGMSPSEATGIWDNIYAQYTQRVEKQRPEYVSRPSKAAMSNELVKLANELDEMGLNEQADEIDKILFE